MRNNNILGKLARVVKSAFGRSGKSSNHVIYNNAESADLSLDISQREKAIYGEDNIKQQKLYEKWAVKTSWHLKNQAIPLLLSIDPEIYSEFPNDEIIEQKCKDLWEHAQHCVEQNLLFVTNKESPVDEWEAKPIDVYKWAAISRVELPKQLSSLMEFVMMSLVSTVSAVDDSVDSKNKNDAMYNSDKERILGAALAMLAIHSEQCTNKKGRVRAENIASLISENENRLFGAEIPRISTIACVDLINEWIKKG